MQGGVGSLLRSNLPYPLVALQRDWEQHEQVCMTPLARPTGSFARCPLIGRRPLQEAVEYYRGLLSRQSAAKLLAALKRKHKVLRKLKSHHLASFVKQRAPRKARRALCVAYLAQRSGA